jgi:FixJ family two-component response regulator
MSDEHAIVAVIDDDQSVREALRGLLETVALKVELFVSVEDFLKRDHSDAPDCIVLDVRLPGPSGLDFQATLASANIHTPIVFITGHGDIPMSVRAMKAGAIEFLTKPFRDQDLLDAVQGGIERVRARRVEEQLTTALRKRFASLTAREQEIMALAAAGRLNKQIAGQIGISEVTVRVHRNQVMQKMGARSLADLVRMADELAR